MWSKSQFEKINIRVLKQKLGNLIIKHSQSKNAGIYCFWLTVEAGQSLWYCCWAGRSTIQLSSALMEIKHLHLHYLYKQKQEDKRESENIKYNCD